MPDYRITLTDEQEAYLRILLALPLNRLPLDSPQAAAILHVFAGLDAGEAATPAAPGPLERLEAVILAEGRAEVYPNGIGGVLVYVWAGEDETEFAGAAPTLAAAVAAALAQVEGGAG